MRRTGIFDVRSMDIAELRDQLERHHRESYGWALSCCSRDPGEAEDVLQTVYLKILEGKARYDRKATFKTWLFSVIRNTAADARRRRLLRRLRVSTYGEPDRHAVQEDRLDDTVHRSHMQEEFRRALAALSRRQREVLQLVFYHDLSLQEAAGVMQVSIGSARVHYDRGKKRLRQWMEVSRVLDESRVGRTGNQGAVPRPAPGG